MARSLWTLIGRDVSLIVLRRQDVLTVVAFFVIVITLFPLSIGPEPDKLRTLAPGGVWVAAALASLISLDRLFADDWRDGTLEQLALSPQPLALVALAKVVAHWLSLGLPLVILSPALGYSLGLEGAELLVLALSLLLGTPVLSLLGAVGAAMTLGVRAGGALMALLILPLYVPVLVLGAGAVSEAMFNASYQAHLSLLGAMLALAVPLVPLAIAGALRIALD
ncbi:heme exporter protein CcmB [Halorhodospira halophila]|uniref:Heme exporter protein B n=1 Tax=Halorhodospira halophila (strain DSM 244 / SL1) TaxID=349124 RepID=A1WWS0_HALHL|nr:heme exporter protein CcmB [Halorhodospira halophila]ABM62132.1 heme exporter protein CcmB [Halorhodospira halophila SL1]MBK1729460.1 heme exporter protein CcmB [Halorhodospira halophila]